MRSLIIIFTAIVLVLDLSPSGWTKPWTHISCQNLSPTSNVDVSNFDLKSTAKSMDQVPANSTRVRKGEKTLHMSPLAIAQIDGLDDLLRDIGVLSEIGATGLVRPLDTQNDVLVEMVMPRHDRILVIDSGINLSGGLIIAGGMEVVEELGTDLVVAMSRASNAEFAIENEALVLKTDKETVQIANQLSFSTNSELRQLLESFIGRVAPEGTDSTYTGLMEQIKKTGPVAINTDWDLILSPTMAYQGISYEHRVLSTAKEKGAYAGFTTHHHPNLDSSLIPKKLKMIRPSGADLMSFERDGSTWNQIRIFGTDGDSDNNSLITSEMYLMDEYFSLTKIIKDEIEALRLSTSDDPAEANLRAMRIRHTFYDLLDKNYEPICVMQALFGEKFYSERNRLWSAPENIKNLVDSVFHSLFTVSDPVRELQKITLEGLERIKDAQIFQLMAIVMPIIRQDEKLEAWLRFHEDYRFVISLPFEQNAESFQKGLVVLNQIINHLIDTKRIHNLEAILTSN